MLARSCLPAFRSRLKTGIKAAILAASAARPASRVPQLPTYPRTRARGRKPTMVIGGLFFLLGASLNAAAQNLAMLYAGRLCLGVGIGFANQVVPLYLSEMAPYQLRGALNQMFQLMVTFGILIAQLINYGIKGWAQGWRLSLGLAAVSTSSKMTSLRFSCSKLMLPLGPNSQAIWMRRATSGYVTIRSLLSGASCCLTYFRKAMTDA